MCEEVIVQNVREIIPGFEEGIFKEQNKTEHSDSKNDEKHVRLCALRMRGATLFVILLFRLRCVIFCKCTFHVSGHIPWPPGSPDFTPTCSSGIMFIQN
jgi:hypothetical protein